MCSQDMASMPLFVSCKVEGIAEGKQHMCATQPAEGCRVHGSSMQGNTRSNNSLAVRCGSARWFTYPSLLLLRTSTSASPSRAVTTACRAWATARRETALRRTSSAACSRRSRSRSASRC